MNDLGTASEGAVLNNLPQDDRVQEKSWWKALFNNFKITYQNLFKSPGRPITKEFYSQPTIKYLARSDFFSKPSYFTPQTFSILSENINNGF